MNYAVKEKYSIDDLRAIMQVLRGENGCPWDREQTHQSIRKNFIEETYEVCEAIDEDDTNLLKEELGDVLLQVIFHSQMEEEKSVFSFDDVVTGICQKLIVRHPHIFSDVKVSGVEDVLKNWSEIKEQTKGQSAVSETLLAVPKQLPALMRSDKVQGRARKANPAFCSIDCESVLSDLKSELVELECAVAQNDRQTLSEELGDVLFSAVAVSRFFELDAEELLSFSCDKFIHRFLLVEKLAQEKGLNIKTVDSDCLDDLWKEVEHLEKKVTQVRH